LKYAKLEDRLKEHQQECVLPVLNGEREPQFMIPRDRIQGNELMR
jgi:hypothetical protein